MDKQDLMAYQLKAIDHILENNYCALFLEMGLGKTVSTLTAISELIYDRLEVSKVLVIAPKRVAQSTWSTEIAKWSHLRHLKLSKVLGTESERKKALMKPADVYVINRENVAWLVGYLGGSWLFDMVVIDELSSFKSPQATRFKALKQVRGRMGRVVGLTGTPAPNGLIDLWSQLYLLDLGERLGRTLTAYRQAFFKPGQSKGHVVFNYRLQNGAEEAIHDKIKDICISMKAKDLLELPERLDIDRVVEMSNEVRKKYDDFEQIEVLKLLESGEEINVGSAAALTNKLLQFSNGAVYGEGKKVFEVHDEKLDEFDEILEESQGDPVLVFYQFKHDIPRLEKRLEKYGVGKVLDGEQDVDDWNVGKFKWLMCHAASAGHGLNLQYGGSIMVWFGLPWSLELYLQAVARLDRQGQTDKVRNFRIVCKGTMEEDVAKALEGKKGSQEALMEAVKARIEKYKI